EQPIPFRGLCKGGGGVERCGDPCGRPGGSLSSAVAVVLTAIFLRERLHVIQWLLIGMLLAEVVLTHVERI
ncbi:MAG: hypothetical protein ACXVCM_23050, partial [Ktedonobacteraceae bacterium]